MNQALNETFKGLASGLVKTSFVSMHALQDRRSACPGDWVTPIKKAPETINLMTKNHMFGWRSCVRFADE